MEFLALLNFTLSNISGHHNSWSCIYCLLFILMQIKLFFNLSAFFEILWQEIDFSRFFVGLLLFSRFTRGDVNFLNRVFLCVFVMKGKVWLPV